MDANLPAAHEERVNGLKEAIRARAASLEEQKSFPDPSPEEFNAEGVLPLADWHPAAEVEDALLEMVDLPEEKHALRIAVGPSGQCVASWRRTVLLAPGKYAFLANIKTQDVESIENERGLGAGLRSSGANRENMRTGTTDWNEQFYEFEVTDVPREIELVAELRATAGEVWFELESLRLEKR
jgi:hypothetical protein